MGALHSFTLTICPDWPGPPAGSRLHYQCDLGKMLSPPRCLSVSIYKTGLTTEPPLASEFLAGEGTSGARPACRWPGLSSREYVKPSWALSWLHPPLTCCERTQEFQQVHATSGDLRAATRSARTDGPCDAFRGAHATDKLRDRVDAPSSRLHLKFTFCLNEK